MTFQLLTPTQLVADGAGLNVTALLATPTNVNLQFANTGREFLVVVPGASSETVTVDVGTTVLGQAVANFASVTMTSTDIYTFGQFHSVLQQPGGSTIQITLSTITSIQVALLQSAGVY
jgi:hypothetical protein